MCTAYSPSLLRFQQKCRAHDAMPYPRNEYHLLKMEQSDEATFLIAPFLYTAFLTFSSV